VKPRTPSTVSDEFASVRPQTRPHRAFDKDCTPKSAHRFRLLSTVLRRQVSLTERAVSFGLSTPAACLLAVTCRASRKMRPTSVCHPNSRLRAPVLAGSRCVRKTCALRGTTGFGAYRVAGGAGVSRRPAPLRRAASRVPKKGMFSPTGPMRPTSDIRVASLAPVLGEPHAFARALLGERGQGHLAPSSREGCRLV